MQLFLVEKEARRMEVPMITDVPIMDSGAAGTMCPKRYAENLAETVVTGNEKTYRTANGHRDRASGFRCVESDAKMSSGRTERVSVNYQVGPVTRPIVSTSQSTKNGKAVWFTRTCSGVCPEENFTFTVKGEYLPFVERRGLYEMQMTPVAGGASSNRPTEVMVAPVEEEEGDAEEATAAVEGRHLQEAEDLELEEQAAHPKPTNKLLSNPMQPSQK